MKRSFYASLDDLHPMLDFIKEQAEISGADSDNISKIELASEEALVNIVNYSYPQRTGRIDIACETHPTADGFRIIIEDQGIPYNPLACLRIPSQKSATELNLGGYGIFLMLQMADEVNYQRLHDTNELILTKYY